MNIDIKPEDIDVYVKEAIIKSSIGKIIKDGATKYMQECLSTSYDSPVKHMVRSIIRDMLEKELSKPENEKIILDEFTKQFNEEIIYNVIRGAIDSISLRFKD